MRTEFSKLFNELEEEDFASIQGEKLLDEFLVRFDTVEKRKQFLEYIKERMYMNGNIFLHPDDPELEKAGYIPYLSRFKDASAIIHLFTFIIPKKIHFIDDEFRQPTERYFFLQLKKEYRVKPEIIRCIVGELCRFEVFNNDTKIDDVLKVFQLFENKKIEPVTFAVDYRKLQLVIDEVFEEIFDKVDLTRIQRSERFIMSNKKPFKAANIYKHRNIYLENDRKENPPKTHVLNKEFISSVKEAISKCSRL